MSSRNAPGEERCVTTLKPACLHTRVRLDFDTQITSFAIERKIRKTDFIFPKFVLGVDFNLEIQIRISWISFFTVLLGNPRRICKTILVNSGRFSANYACAWEKVFKSLIKRKETRKSRTDFSRLIRFYGSSRFCCNPKFRISQSKSRFPNRAHS